MAAPSRKPEGATHAQRIEVINIRTGDSYFYEEYVDDEMNIIETDGDLRLAPVLHVIRDIDDPDDAADDPEVNRVLRDVTAMLVNEERGTTGGWKRIPKRSMH